MHQLKPRKNIQKRKLLFAKMFRNQVKRLNFKVNLTVNQGEFAPRSKLPREIWRWLLGFSLKGKTKNVRRDFSNGYVIAEVLHQYFPMDIQLPEFRNGESFPIKMANWQQLGINYIKSAVTVSPVAFIFPSSHSYFHH